MDADALRQLKSNYEYVRAWTIQLMCEGNKIPPGATADFARMAWEDKSRVVRLYLASALQRMPVEDRWPVLEGLSAHAEDANDHNLPLVVWCAAEPMTTQNSKRALTMAESTKLQHPLNSTGRRTDAIATAEAFAAVTDSLMRVADHDAQVLDVLNGLSLGLQGRRSAPMPAGWAAVEAKLGSSPNAEVRARAQTLSLTFGSANALASLKKTLMDPSAGANARRTAGEALLGAKEPTLAPLLPQLVIDPELRSLALRGLPADDDPRTPAAILGAYPAFNDAGKRDALNTLSARVNFAKPLIEAVREGRVPKKDLTAEVVRQLRGLKNAELDHDIEQVWGVMRHTAADKQNDTAKYRRVFDA